MRRGERSKAWRAWRGRAASKARLRRWLQPFPHLEQQTWTARTPESLMKAMGWTELPEIPDELRSPYNDLTHLNDRRLMDLQVIGAACRNERCGIILEIGTGKGETTAFIARSAPAARVYTVNLPPDADPVSAGRNITGMPSLAEIGARHRSLGCSNVTQILANTKDWEPDFGPIDLAFIDGCHDAEFVYRDTRKVLARCRPGSLILWHDFMPTLAERYPWIDEVCTGVEWLLRDRSVAGPLLHLQDSWIGLYRVPGA